MKGTRTDRKDRTPKQQRMHEAGLRFQARKRAKNTMTPEQYSEFCGAQEANPRRKAKQKLLIPEITLMTEAERMQAELYAMEARIKIAARVDAVLEKYNHRDRTGFEGDTPITPAERERRRIYQRAYKKRRKERNANTE